jgi:cyclopropane-fatty-acyl-phospholipid synthase
MARQGLDPLGVPGSGHTVATTDTHAKSPPTGLDRWLARQFVRGAAALPVDLVLWQGETIASTSTAAARVRIADRGALWKLALHPGLAFGDLYSVGRVRVEGDLVDTLEAVYRAIGTLRGRNGFKRIVQKILLSSAPSLARSRENIHHHYDLGNDFYELWLDREAMQYTCAYYPTSEMSLEEAQRAKMDHVCRKLWLRPGECVVEAGCGWGGFALHMARSYGVKVRAFNISHEQIAYGREWAAREGLTDRVEFVEDDYRNIDGRYDVFVSVGMLEHVGPGNYRELGRVIDRCLAPEGRGLIHSIGRDRPSRLNPWIRKRIFPGGYPPTLREMSEIFEPAGFSVLDVENLRLHYAATLREWLARYERNEEQVRAMFDDRFVRAWRLYLAGSIAGFSTGTLQLFQVLFARSGENGLPASRNHVYATGSPSGESH